MHRLRANCDAVIVGGGTLRLDNPLLTSRGISDPEPLRVVLTKTLNLPASSNLWDTKVAQTLIAYDSESAKENLRKLPEGPTKLELSASKPIELANALATRGTNKVLWECGGALATEAISQGCVQEIFCFLAPKLLGGVSAMTPLSDFGFTSLDEY